MQKLPTVSFILDSYKNREKTQAIRLQLYYHQQQLPPVPTTLRTTKEIFRSRFTSRKIESVTLQKELFRQEEKAIAILNTLKPFDYDRFKKAWLGTNEIVRSSSKTDLFSLFERYKLNRTNKGKTNAAYDNAYNNFEKYNVKNNKQPAGSLTLEQVTPKWLYEWEDWNVARGREINTISVYARCLKAVYRASIQDNEVWRTVHGYPFGKKADGKYQIPVGEETENYITIEQRDELIAYRDELYTKRLETDNKVEVRKAINKAKAIDYWLFGYHLAGANYEDFLNFTWRNIHRNKDGNYVIRFKRSKVKNAKEIELPINPVLQTILFAETKNHYLLPILNDTMTDNEKAIQKAYWAKWVNKRLKAVAQDLHFPDRLNLATSRQSHTTHASELGYTDDEIGYTLGHKRKNRNDMTARYNKKKVKPERLYQMMSELSEYQKIDEDSWHDLNEIFEEGELPKLIKEMIEARINAAKVKPLRKEAVKEEHQLKAVKGRKSA